MNQPVCLLLRFKLKAFACYSDENKFILGSEKQIPKRCSDVYAIWMPIIQNLQYLQDFEINDSNFEGMVIISDLKLLAPVPNASNVFSQKISGSGDKRSSVWPSK